MDAGTGKIAGALILLASVWIFVYWAWTPSPTISSSSDSSGVTPRPSLAGNGSASTRPAPTPSNSDRPALPREPIASTPPQRPETAPRVREPDPNATPNPPRPIAVIPPEFFDHVIEKGETFTSIAEKYYGDPRLAHAVAEANPFVSPTSLRPGRVIRVAKDPKNIQGIPIKPPAGETPPATQGPREYIIAPGDTLSAIAKRLLGNTKYADDIYRANRDRLASPDDLRVGQTIRIPKVE